jgi:hypothetical protein
MPTVKSGIKLQKLCSELNGANKITYERFIQNVTWKALTEPRRCRGPLLWGCFLAQDLVQYETKFGQFICQHDGHVLGCTTIPEGK